MGDEDQIKLCFFLLLYAELYKIFIEIWMVFDGFFMVIRLRVNKWYLQFSKLVSIEYYILHLAIIWGNTLLRSYIIS